MIDWIVLALAVGICFGINALDKRNVVNPWRVGAIALGVLVVVELWALFLLPGSHPYQEGAILGRATVPLIIALYMSDKFAKRHSAQPGIASTPSAMTETQDTIGGQPAPPADGSAAR